MLKPEQLSLIDGGRDMREALTLNGHVSGKTLELGIRDLYQRGQPLPQFNRKRGVSLKRNASNQTGSRFQGNGSWPTVFRPAAVKPLTALKTFRQAASLALIILASACSAAFGSAPNLTPYQPPGWSDKIVVSTNTGTTTDSPSLYTNDVLYVDWAVINNGDAVAGGFYAALYVDGQFKTNWAILPSLNPNSYTNINDYALGSLVIPGTHTLTIMYDWGNLIAESNESDNAYTKTILVKPHPLANLTPYQPPGWSDKLIVSSVKGSTNDSPTLYTNDTIYVGWAVINNGDAAAFCRVGGPPDYGFDTILYVDGKYVLGMDWFVPPLNTNSYFATNGCSLGKLTQGTHTLVITNDVWNEVYEINELDNAYTKTIVVNLPLPNLTPYQPPGWSDKIVVSSVTGTTTNSPLLYANDTIYVDWAVINNDTVSVTNRFYTALYVDGLLKTSWYCDPPLATNSFFSVTDYSIGSFGIGTHQLYLAADSTYAIAESNETDNTYSRTFVISPPPQPNLALYQPPGWSDKVVVSKNLGSTTDSPATTADTLYASWAVGNIGSAPVTNGFLTTLALDGVLMHTWSNGPPLNPSSYVAVTNYLLGTLSVGLHIITLATDTGSSVAESNEVDNSYVKPVGVSQTRPNLAPYQPAGWSDKVVVSTNLNATTDSPCLAGVPLYASWAVGNIGSAPVTNGFLTTLSLDGNVLGTWTNAPPLAPANFVWATNYCLGALTSGVHTVTLATDTGGSVTESDEGDNSYIKTLVVQGPPIIGGVAVVFSYTNPISGLVDAWMTGTANANGATWLIMQCYWGTLSAKPLAWQMGSWGSNSWANYTDQEPLGTLIPGLTYHYHLAATNEFGGVVSPDQTLTAPFLYPPGDLNGDGIVDQSELNTVLSNYWPASPWLYLTNIAGLGGSNVSFALNNPMSGAYSVMMSTNLVNWEYLGPATPRYLFTDTNAPALPQRFYRLRWP